MDRNIIVYIVVIAIGCLGGCHTTVPSVHFIIPKDFRGAALIYVDEVRGVALAKKNEKYTISIPTDGVVRVKSAAPLNEWHHSSAIFDDGTSLPIGMKDELENAGNVSLWHVGTDSTGCHVYFVGTQADFKALTLNPRIPGGVPPGSVKQKP